LGSPATEAIPLGLGYISAYLQNWFAEAINVRLMVFPEDLDHAVAGDLKPDIVGFGTFTWNRNLTDYYSKKIKDAINPLILYGGQELPIGSDQQTRFMMERPFVDFCVPAEGEIGMRNIVERYLNSSKDIESMKIKAIEGVIFLDSNSDLVSENNEIEPVNLNDLPSPILTGVFDDFFQKGLTPMLQFVRGCPNKCAYCRQGSVESKKIRRYPSKISLEAILYLEKRVENIGKHLSKLAEDHGCKPVGEC
jgi:radical SAM superfamily enzyme YgiQ (UPF0313 family)